MLDAATFYRSLPKKRMGAGALFFDEQNRILIVNPTYRPYWLLPGGSIEENESPLLACTREVKEELGIDVQLQRLLCVAYMPEIGEKTESLQFIFYGGILTPAQIQRIVLPEEELSEYRFVSYDEATQFLNPALARRISHCFFALQQHTTVYLENDRNPFGTPYMS